MWYKYIDEGNTIGSLTLTLTLNFIERYLQRLVGIEFCFNNNRTALFVFSKADFPVAYTEIRSDLDLKHLSGHS